MKQGTNLAGIGSRRSLLAVVSALAALMTALALVFVVGARPAAAQGNASEYLTPWEQEKLEQAAEDGPEAFGPVNATATKSTGNLSFGGVQVGNSATQTVTVRGNTFGCFDTDIPFVPCLGDFPAKVASVSVTGDGYSILSNTCNNRELDPNETCTITVRFQSNSLGFKSGSLNIVPSSVTFNILGFGIFTVPTTIIGGNTVSLQGNGVDPVPPNTFINSGPSGLTNDNTPTFTFSGVDNLTPIANLLFSHSVDGGAFSALSGATSVTLPVQSDGPHTFSVRARDQAGNVDPDPAQRSFTVDTAAPNVGAVAPLGKKVSFKANATATFNEDMNEGSVEAPGVFTLTKKGSASPVAAVVSYDVGTDKVTLNPNKSLKRGAVYTAKVTTGARDLAGNALAAQKTWKFTVKK